MLMYHAVVPGPGTPAWPWAVSADGFEAQIDYLQDNGWTSRTMAELAASKSPPRTVVITFDDGYANNLAAFEMLAKRDMRATWFIVSGSVGQDPKWPADGRPAGRLLSGQELRTMCDAGMEIGSHTQSHCVLTQLDQARVDKELRASKAELEDVLGGVVGSFAYPYGKFDDGIVRSVAAAGYTAACTTRTGWATRDGDPYRLRRVSIMNNDTVSTLARKLALADNDVGWDKLARYGMNRVRARLPF
jgi:peptidoglycan/xylan/chitin deacetylase (PgdA/CDA1 family)